MKILWLQAGVLLLCIVWAGVALAQGSRKLYKAQENDSIKNVFTDGRQAFLDERLYQPFPLLGYDTAIDRTVYDFDQAGRCRVIEFGFSDCAPCRVQLPYFIALSNDKRYADVDFLYISYDDPATIRKDITSLYHGPYDRLKIFSFDKAYFTYSDKPMLTYGFPTMYFIDRNRMVKTIITGGSAVPVTDEGQLLKARWTSYIDAMLHN